MRWIVPGSMKCVSGRPGLAIALACCLAGCTGSPDAASVDAAIGPDISGDALIDTLVDTLLVQGLIGPEGGTLHDAERQITVTLPAGAVTAPTTVRLYARDLVAAKADDASGDPWVVPTRRFLLEPAGLVLAQKAWISVSMPANDAPFKATRHDIGIYHHDPTGWHAIEDLAAPSGILMNFPDTLSSNGHFSHFGEIAARLHPPYDHPPELMQLGYYKAYSTPAGPTTTLPAGGLQSIWGRNFGWDPSKVEVVVAGKAVVPTTTTSSMVEFPMAVKQPESDIEINVVVRVQGVSSNTLRVKIAGLTSGKPLIDKVIPPGGAARGTRVILMGTFFGSAETRSVLLGGVKVAHVMDDWGQLRFIVPDDAPPGPTQITVEDGLGGAPSDPQPYVVLPSTSPVLSLGLEEGGVWLPPHQPSAPGLPLPPVDLVLDVANMPPKVSDMSLVEMRFVAGTLDTGWTQSIDGNLHLPACEGVPTGRCVLAVPDALVQTLEAGDSLSVSVRVRNSEVPLDLAEDLPAQQVWRESAPLTVLVAGRGFVGATLFPSYVGPNNKTIWGMCHQGGGPLNVGDLLCLRMGESCWEGTCASMQEISAPELWPGQLEWGSGPNGAHRVRGRCLMLTKPMTIHLQNQTLGVSCELGVVAAGGSLSADVTGVDPAQGITLGMGGGRLSIPPGALPALANGQKYLVQSIAATAGDPANPPIQTGDPQAATELGTYRIQIFPEPPKLLKPIGLRVPVNPAKAAPSLALIDKDTGFAFDVDAIFDALAGQLAWSLPAGRYEAPKADSPPDSTPVALPIQFNKAFEHVGVVYNKDTPGQIEDAKGRIRVEYVVDKTSADYCTDAYAEQALQAAVAAWGVLASWEAPQTPVRVFIRATVSWASSTAKGATGLDLLGNPQVTIRKDLATEGELRYVVAHEFGHVFQRSYTTNTLLSWLDEGAAEWAAYATAAAVFDMDGLNGDQDAVRLVMAGMPNSWSGVSKTYIYGASAWILWLAWKKGDGTVRKLYEQLKWNPPNWASAWWTFEAATGSTVPSLMRDFADDFWLQRFPPIDKLTISADLAGIGPVPVVKLVATGAPEVSLAEQPPLSSKRYRMDVSSKLKDEIGAGDLILRTTDLGDLEEVSIWRDPTLTPDPTSPELVVRLTTNEPFKVLTELQTGSWWVLHNRWATSGMGKGVFVIEVPRIASLSPGQAKSGDVVQVTGTSFGKATGKVSVGGTPASIVSWSPQLVKFTMPYFANTQAVTVRVNTGDGAKTNDVMLSVLSP